MVLNWKKLNTCYNTTLLCICFISKHSLLFKNISWPHNDTGALAFCLCLFLSSHVWFSGLTQTWSEAVRIAYAIRCQAIFKPVMMRKIPWEVIWEFFNIQVIWLCKNHIFLSCAMLSLYIRRSEPSDADNVIIRLDNAHSSPFYYHGLTVIVPWMNKCIQRFVWYAIIQPCHNFTDSWIKSPLASWPVRVIISHCFASL